MKNQPRKDGDVIERKVLSDDHEAGKQTLREIVESFDPKTDRLILMHIPVKEGQESTAAKLIVCCKGGYNRAWMLHRIVQHSGIDPKMFAMSLATGLFDNSTEEEE